ncbi:PAS domain S-box protein [Azospirillum sp. TSO22-1]|uniref:PAS domain S-box protein n=1 Tax=Azospirillum sp. TSO22-1 TaxID=716789 RepID=UPI000D65C7C7|nr:PAS domain S-box protein [Azospirillum sp. TSO22-1]
MNTLTAPPSLAVTTAPAVFVRFRIGLMVLVLLAALGLTAAAVTEIVHARAQADDEALRHVQNLAKTLELHARGTFRTASLAAAAVTEAVTPRPGAEPPADEEVQRLMTRLMAGDGAIRNLTVADADGWVRLDAVPPVRGIRVADREYFKAHQGPEDRGPFVSAPMISRVYRDWAMVISRRVSDPAGGFAGIVYATIDLSTVRQFYASLDVGPQGSVTLWTPEGYLLARHPESTEPRFSPSQLAAATREALAGRREGVITGPSTIDGVNRVAAFRAVEGLPLYVSVRLAEQDYLAGWRASARQSMLVLAAEIAVVLALTALLLRYLRRLEATARALQDSENRARAIFDSTFQYMALLEPDGRILAVNRAGLDFGEERFDDGDLSTVAGCPAWKMRAWRRRPESVERMRDAVERAAAGTLVRFEAELQGLDGVHTVDCSVKPVHDGDGRVVLLIAEARDISERKRIENSLRQSEARLRSYLDAAMEGILVTDCTGRYVDANPAACEILGYTRDELLTRSVRDILTEAPRTADGLPDIFATLLYTGEFRGETVMRRRDGELRLAEVTAVRLDDDRNLSVIRDVTERRAAEEALRTSTARLGALVQALPDIAFILDGEGRYREVLAAHDDLVSVPPRQVIGRHITEVLPPEAARRMAEVIARTLRSAQPQAVEYVLQVPAGRRWYEARTAALPPDFGSRSMVLVLARDITERVLAAERLAQAKEQAESASRIKSNFLATMSHELRTPLNAIIGFSEIMVHQVFGPIGSDRYADYARHIQQSGSHLLELINDVLDMSKLEAGRYTLEDRVMKLDAVLDACLTVSTVPAEAGGVALVPAFIQPLPRLRGDERAVRQVVLNLLANAVKFTPPGGQVTLSAAPAPGGGLDLVVADTGIGIAPEALRTITEPFQQADNSISRRFGGTGLGLAISRNLVELHGGSLSIASEPGRGTTVTVRFPADRVVREAALEAAADPA